MGDRPAKRYNPREITEGLLAVVATGSTRRAADLTGVPRQTLDYWVQSREDEYRDLHDKHKAEIEDDVARRMRDKLRLADEVETAAIELERERIAKGEIKDAAASARNMATVKGINADKLLTLTGRPTAITEHRNTDELLGSLQRLGIAVDGTAEEIDDDTPLLDAG